MKVCPVPFAEEADDDNDDNNDTDGGISTHDDTAAFQKAADALKKEGKPISLGALFVRSGKA